jgi:hypothetical protein
MSGELRVRTIKSSLSNLYGYRRFQGEAVCQTAGEKQEIRIKTREEATGVAQ